MLCLPVEERKHSIKVVLSLKYRQLMIYASEAQAVLQGASCIGFRLPILSHRDLLLLLPSLAS